MPKFHSDVNAEKQKKIFFIQQPLLQKYYDKYVNGRIIHATITHEMQY